MSHRHTGMFLSAFLLSLLFLSCVLPLVICQPTSECPIHLAWNVSIPHRFSSEYDLLPLGLVRAPYCVLYGVLDVDINIAIIPQFFVIEVTRGQLLWTRDYINEGFESFVNEDQGIIYIGSDSQNTTTYCTTLHAVDLMSGVSRWNNRHCRSGVTNLFVADVVLLSGRNRDGTDYVVQLTTAYAGNLSSTTVEVLNSRGRVVDSMEINYGPVSAEVVSDGRNGYFLTSGWPDNSQRELTSMWHVSRDGTLTHQWNERRFVPPFMSTPAPLMVKSITDPSHWVGLSEVDGSVIWSTYHTGRVFLSPDWPNGLTTEHEPEYELVTPAEWSHQPARVSHALFSVYRLINITALEMIENMGWAVYDTQTGNQVARSDIIPVIIPITPPAHSLSSSSLYNSLSLTIPRKLQLQRNQPGPDPPTRCRVTESTSNFFRTILNDRATDSLIFNLEDSLYVLDGGTLETVMIRPLPKLPFECPVIMSYDSQGTSIAFNSDGESAWLIGIPGGAPPSASAVIAKDLVE